MYGAWLVGVLLATAMPGVNRAEPPYLWCGPIDVERDALRGMLGPCDWRSDRTDWYTGTDLLGGEWAIEVTFDRWLLQARDFRVGYVPFADTPPWLEAIHSAIAPAGK